MNHWTIIKLCVHKLNVVHHGSYCWYNSLQSQWIPPGEVLVATIWCRLESIRGMTQEFQKCTITFVDIRDNAHYNAQEFQWPLQSFWQFALYYIEGLDNVSIFTNKGTSTDNSRLVSTSERRQLWTFNPTRVMGKQLFGSLVTVIIIQIGSRSQAQLHISLLWMSTGKGVIRKPITAYVGSLFTVNIPS